VADAVFFASSQADAWSALDATTAAVIPRTQSLRVMIGAS
jgi:hypothetical protein